MKIAEHRLPASLEDCCTASTTGWPIAFPGAQRRQGFLTLSPVRLIILTEFVFDTKAKLLPLLSASRGANHSMSHFGVVVLSQVRS